MRKFAAISLAGLWLLAHFQLWLRRQAQRKQAQRQLPRLAVRQLSQIQVENNWEPFAENVTLRVPVYDRGVEGVPDVTNNYWTQWIQENFGDKYNITVEYVPITRLML